MEADFLATRAFLAGGSRTLLASVPETKTVALASSSSGSASIASDFLLGAMVSGRRRKVGVGGRKENVRKPSQLFFGLYTRKPGS